MILKHLQYLNQHDSTTHEPQPVAAFRLLAATLATRVSAVSAGAAVERSVRAPNVSSDVENRISHTLYTRAAPSPVGGAPTAWWRAGRVGAGVQTSAQSQTRSRHTHSDILFRCGAYAQGSCPEWQPIYGPSRPMEHSTFVENNIRSSEL